MVSLSALHNGSIYTPADIPVTNSVTGWVEHRAIVWTEVLCQWTFPTYIAVPQPTAAPRALYCQYCAIKFCSVRCYIEFDHNTNFCVLLPVGWITSCSTSFIELWKVQLRNLMFQKVKDKSRKKIRQNDWPLDRQPVTISRSQFKNWQEFTFNRCSSLEKKSTVYQSLKIRHEKMRIKAHHVVGKITSGREYISMFLFCVDFRKIRKNTKLPIFVKQNVFN